MWKEAYCCLDIWDILFIYCELLSWGKWYNADFLDGIAVKKKGMETYVKKLILVTSSPASGKTYICSGWAAV